MYNVIIICHDILLWMNNYFRRIYYYYYNNNISVRRIWIFGIYVYTNPQKRVKRWPFINYTYLLQCLDDEFIPFFFFYNIYSVLQLRRILVCSNLTFTKIRYWFTLYLNANTDHIMLSIFVTNGNHVICKQSNFRFSWANYNSRVSPCYLKYKIKKNHFEVHILGCRIIYIM